MALGYAIAMLQDRILSREQARHREAETRRRHGERRFEALYMQSFIEMRARHPKG